MSAAAIAAALLALPAPNAVTPDGPATLWSPWRGAITLEGRWPSVLTHVRVTVGAGGRAGMIRPRVTEDARTGPLLAAEPVLLPAEPGTYDFAVPHVKWDYREGGIAIDQADGGHAIVAREECTPERGRYGDICQVVALDAFRPVLPDGAFPATGTAPESVPGARLTVEGVSETDLDGDLAGDLTEDRTDLRLGVRRTGNRLRVTVHNAGARIADQPLLVVRGERPGGVRPCRLARSLRPELWSTAQQSVCKLAPLPPGATRRLTFRHRPRDPDQLPPRDVLRVSLRSEGPDLAPRDNARTLR